MARHRPATVQRPPRCVVCTHLWPCPAERARRWAAVAEDILRGVRESGEAFDRAYINAWAPASDQEVDGDG